MSNTKSDYKEDLEKVTVVFETNLGTFEGELFAKECPETVWNFINLAEGRQKTDRPGNFYDGLIFHRVIDGFMAQTGDVQNGVMGGDLSRAGTGGSDLGNIPAEFSDLPFERGVVGMARSQNPNSANSQFFIMFEPGYFLNGQYTVVGAVTAGMDIVDAIKRTNDARFAAAGTEHSAPGGFRRLDAVADDPTARDLGQR